MKLRILDLVSNALLDSGSHSSLINKELAQRLSREYDLKIHKCNARLKAITGDELSILGQITLPFQFDEKVQYFNLIVIEENFAHKILLGRNFMRAFDVSMHFGIKNPTVSIRGVPQVCVKTNYESLGVNFIIKEPAKNYLARARFPKFCIKGANYGQIELTVPKYLNNKTIYFEATETNPLLMPRTVAKVHNGKNNRAGS